MNKILLFLVILLIVLTGITIFVGSKYVTKTGNIIWVSDSRAKGEWIQNEISETWWSELSDQKLKTTIVYLSPYREFSSNSLMKNDKAVAYVNWSKFANIDTLRVSIEWDEWEKIDDSKNNRLISLIAQKIAIKQNVDKQKIAEYTSKVITFDKSPTEITIK